MAEISFATLGSCPVPGETPAGDDARYEPEYAAVLEEIEKLSFSAQGAAVSWSAIEKNAILILSEKSKDLQIASYLGVALWQNRGIEGLLDGVRVLAGFLETFWETGWPALKRMRGRVNAVDWWHERAYNFLQEAAGQLPPVSPDLRQELLDELARLDDLVSSLMPDASSLHDLSAAARRLPVVQADQPVEEPPAPQIKEEQEQKEQEKKAEPTPEPAPVPEPPASTPTPEPAPVPEAPAPVPTPEPAQATEDPAVLRRNFVTSGLAYLASARRAAPDNASLWQLSRLIIWGGIVALPASENGQTLLPPPDTATLARARQKLRAGDALEAALEAEDFFATAPFLLDAQEVAHAALSALGPRFADAAASVAKESAGFFSRLPGLEKLSFIDGTPFASPETIAWLRGAAVAPPRESARPAPGDDRFKAVFASAGELMAANKLTEALAVLDAAKTESLSANMRLRACQLRLLREGGRLEAAQALAEALLRETSSRDLDNWDPELSLETLIAVRNVFILNPSLHERELRDVRRRIARLSPAALD